MTEKLESRSNFGLVSSAGAHELSVRKARRLGTRLAIKEWTGLRTPVRRCLSLFRHPSYLITWLSPVSFTRQREFAFVFESIARYRPVPKVILDISSPKLLPITVAHARPGARVHSVDILEAEVSRVNQATQLLSLSNLSAEVQDARKLPFADGHFDLITSVSVFEHIAPENDGEVLAARELGRVLAPGGVAFLTVPFSRRYFAEYHAETVYERTSLDGQPIFYQRFYDLDLLNRNLVAASGLELQSLEFVEERFFFSDPNRRVANYINGTGRQTLAFGLFYPILSRVFLSRPKRLDRCRKPYIACLVLRKPEKC